MNFELRWEIIAQFLFGYVFYYPFFMAYLWMAGGLAHYLFFEARGQGRRLKAPTLSSYPKVTIVVPCYNEAASVRDVIASLTRLRYPDYEIIAIDDGSTDATGTILDILALETPQLRVVHQAGNQGKAIGLITGTTLAQGDFILGLDGDAILDPDALTWLLRPMLMSDDVGAVTGNPRIRTRTTLLGRMQVGEFSSTIGLIKRTQQLFGRLFTVSGVIVMFRRKALLDVGLWSPDMLTEDIDISWKLQLSGWGLRFEPRARCWILMPETIKGLFRQRLRWAMGGVQALQKYSVAVLKPTQWRMWPIYFEYMASVFWAYAMFTVLLLSFTHRFLELEGAWDVHFLPAWHGLLLGFTCMLQILLSLWIDRRYDVHLLRYYLWTIWYPVAFWMINMLTAVIAVPAVLLRRRGRRATWTSPDRGIAHVRT